ncbi:Glutathione reductase [Yamadazyma tenuis]|uniref:Glutathione reductase n=1 Tax=Candida tenuis (strain ATCC 10573 / BCRC 21748 / CBS 615 / JCM 9827 / NBRC 10315 / NRRL Y-1498 / VKM Y-70) TaxID=590646 RepID=G3B999_CANTC|nr:glutathione reductase [Yamadazyma tenuis ATCC 10573]EGV61844.1 glutathione reductase [Yamadazyma tenuis ATCC 10573]WEJ93073.1 Glutathione reductase [Yamadazyma tenuis]
MAPVTIPKHYDYLVIGGGSGGVASARRAASYGKKVLLVEAKPHKLGGTCVNVGCVPKKVMWYAADLAHRKVHLSKYGLSRSSVEENEVKHGDFDWSYFKTKRDAYITRLNGIYARNLTNEGVEFLYGYARFTNDQADVEVTLTEDQEIPFLETGEKSFSKDQKFVFSADKVLVATGGAPIVPPSVPGAELGITSDGFFELDYQPKSVAVVGAGYIGVELAGVFRSLGSETHLVIRGDTVLRAFDDSIQETITDYYSDKLGVNVIKQSGSVSKVEKLANGLKKVYLGNGSTLEVEELVWTVGRRALSDIGLDVVGVKANDRGQVIADEYQQTSHSKVFSLGDVVGKVELTPVAIAAGRKLSNRLFSGQEVFAQDKLDYNNVPSVIFSHPEAGSIGLSEKEATDKYGKDNIKVYKSKFVAMYNAMLEDDELKQPTYYKIIVTGVDEKVIGLHMVGEATGEILQGFGVAVKMGATKADFDNCVAIHPTSAEELVTMR